MPWYLSPSGVLTHADGGLAAACVGRGYRHVPDDEAAGMVADRVGLEIDHTPPPVDQDAIDRALTEEPPLPSRKRTRKGLPR